MKKIKITILLLVMVAFTFSMQSCFKKDSPEYTALVTVRITGPNQYYFIMDGGKKIYPGSISRLEGLYKPVDGSRALIYYSTLKEVVSGYDYNADIYTIRTITTKEILKLEVPKDDTLGNNSLRIRNMWVGGGYLNIELLVELMGKKEHYFNLVDNHLVENAADYKRLEFRHNANGDSTGYENYGMICFKLGQFDPMLSGVPLKVITDSKEGKKEFEFKVK